MLIEKEKKAAEKKADDKKSEDKKQNEKKPDDKAKPPQVSLGAVGETDLVRGEHAVARGAL